MTVAREESPLNSTYTVTPVAIEPKQQLKKSFDGIATENDDSSALINVGGEANDSDNNESMDHAPTFHPVKQTQIRKKQAEVESQQQVNAAPCLVS